MLNCPPTPEASVSASSSDASQSSSSAIVVLSSPALEGLHLVVMHNVKRVPKAALSEEAAAQQREEERRRLDAYKDMERTYLEHVRRHFC